MPIVRVEMVGPKEGPYKRAMLRAVRSGVQDALGVPQERVTVRLLELEPECVDLPGCRTERFTVVEIMLYEGRTPELKLACTQAIRDNLADDPGIEASDVAVLYRDVTPVDLNLLPGAADSCK